MKKVLSLVFTLALSGGLCAQPLRTFNLEEVYMEIPGNVKQENIAYSVKNTAGPAAQQSLWDAKKEKWNINAPESYLGWLDVYNQVLAQAGDITAWVETFRKDYDDCIVVGMGGSSLSVEVMKNLFGKKKGYPALTILDTSNPDTFVKIENKINLKRTLFIISSKSGTTVETLYGYEYFFNRLKGVSDTPGDNFIAITDSGSKLHKEAQTNNFKAVFLNRKDIGGRFSALSYFGMIPAAIAGYDIKAILSSAQSYAKYLQENSALPFLLAETISPKGNNSKRLFLGLDDKLSGFGLWVEQLLSESLGKNGKDVIPLVVKKDFSALLGKDDVIAFVGLKNKKEAPFANKTVYLTIKDKAEIGKLFLLWEFAVAIAGDIMEINPFDQPNVELSKKLATGLLKEDGANLADALILSERIGKEFGANTNVKDIMLQAGKKASYITLMLYADVDKKTEKRLLAYAKHLQKETGTPVVITYGPRYLHSLGQMHKGGSNTGLFLIITDIKNDLILPNGSSMKKLILSQAYGDFMALDNSGGAAIKVNIGKDETLGAYLLNLTK